MRGLLTVVAVAGVVVLLATSSLPVPIGTTTSDSMSPTLEKGETFVALPPWLVGGIDTGSIVVYRGMDGWTVHRVVDSSTTAVVTAGDANVFTDQQAGETPIHRSEILGVVPTIGGHPLAIDFRRSSLEWWQVGLLGGLVLSMLNRPRLAPPVSQRLPLIVGALATALVILAWYVDTGIDHDAIAAIHNTGPLPLVTISSHADATSVLWPSQALESPPPSVTTIPGWAPRSVLSFVVDLDRHLGLVLVSATTGTVSYMIVRLGQWAADR